MREEVLTNSSFVEALLEKWRRRKWLLICCFLLVFCSMTSFVLALPSLYTSSTTLLFGQEGISESLVMERTPNELELRLGTITQAVLSRSQLQEVIDEFDLYANMRLKASPEAVIKRLRKDINIEQRAATQPQWGQNSTYSITIAYQSWDPELAADVVNNLATRFKTENERVRTGQAVRTTQFIRTQMEEARTRLSEEENRINEFKNAHMGELPEQQSINLATLERLNTELRLKGEQQIQLSARRNELLFGNNANGEDNALAGLTGSLRLDRLEHDLAELKKRYTPSYPDVIRLEKEIGELKLELAASDLAAGTDPDAAQRQKLQNPVEIDLELATLKQEEIAIQTTIDELVTRIEDTPFIDQQLKRLAYDYDTAREDYLALQKQFQNARLAESLELQQNEQFKVLEAAIPGDFPTAPNQKRLMFLVLVLATGLAGGAGLFAEQVDTSFHSNADIRRFTRIPVLAVINNIQTSADRWRLTLRYVLRGIMLVIGILLLVFYSQVAGSSAQQIVWMLAE